MAPLSIALLIESDGPAGAEKMMLHLAEALRDRGHAVCPVGPGNGCGWLASEFRRRGFAPEQFVIRRYLDWRCLRGLVDTLRRRRVDVVHSHDFMMAVYGAAAAAWLRRPHVITMHGGRYFADRWSRRVALRWAAARSSAAVAVSAALQADLARVLRLPRAIFPVVHNGIRPCVGSPEDVRRELGIGAEEPLIVSIGNLYPVKGHLVLLQAMQALAGCHVVIAGQGAEEATLKAYAAEHGLAPYVHLLGYRADVADLLAAADVFALPSLSEGVPLALLEAMFAGKGIVASGVGGVPEVVTSEREALLVPPEDPRALATALARLLKDPALRRHLGDAARQRATRAFTVDTMVDGYLRLYAGAVQRQRRHTPRLIATPDARP
ncbi:MAG TPA: glycosyltransferase family 4 protein [Gemmatimonadales bacterium]|jgi:glycosyltransferase involved in cell wall biosynthesis|nr:glycosyltransferase family 4 protein [Gemmatimonadales bacterium]